MLARSEEISHRKFFPPLSVYIPDSNWNLKEYLPCHKSSQDLPSSQIPEHLGYHPVLYQERMKSEPQLPFEILQLFHSHTTTPSPDPQPMTIHAARVEMTTPFGPGHDDVIGMSGLPSNELQHYLQNFMKKKLHKNLQYKKLGNKFHSTAVAAIGVIVEELTTDFMITWREKIQQRLTERKSLSSNVLVSEERDEQNQSKEVYEKQIHSILPQSSQEILLSMGGMLPGPLEYSTRLFERIATLQIRGADLKTRPEDLLLIIQNRLECLFGMKLSEEHVEYLQYLLHEERIKQDGNQKEFHDILLKQSQEFFPLKRHPVKLTKK